MNGLLNRVAKILNHDGDHVVPGISRAQIRRLLGGLECQKLEKLQLEIMLLVYQPTAIFPGPGNTLHLGSRRREKQKPTPLTKLKTLWFQSRKAGAPCVQNAIWDISLPVINVTLLYICFIA